MTSSPFFVERPRSPSPPPAPAPAPGGYHHQGVGERINLSYELDGIKKFFMTYLYQPFRDLKGVIRMFASRVLTVTMIVAISIMIVLLGLFLWRILHRYLAHYDKNPFKFKYNWATTDLDLETIRDLDLEVGVYDS
ncbi:hypothetical protein ACFE04_028618 [Oxalis oulophora]